MGFFDKLFGQKDWATHVSTKYGFQVSHPPDWVVQEKPDGVDIRPPTFQMLADPELGVEIPAPGIHVSVREYPGGDVPDTKDVLRGRGSVFENYRVMDHISNEVPKADRAVVYEFGFATGGKAFRVVSLVAFKGNRLFDVKACERADVFDKVGKTFRQIMKGFKVD